MRDRLISLLCFALLGALVVFYTDQIYQSSLAPPQQHHGRTNGPRAYEAQNESIQDVSAETVAYYTKVLAGFTGVLALVSCLQIWLLIQGARAGREQAAEMKIASGLAETQNAIIAAQTDIQTKQHALSRFQFIATHRPRLIVRHVAITVQIFARAFDAEKWVVYVMGQIKYHDEGGADRFMGFCRERRSDGKFRPVEDPDYEYQD
jgi:hypothetical protein